MGIRLNISARKMSEFKIDENIFECNDENRLVDILKDNGVEPSHQIQESYTPQIGDTVLIIAGSLLWSVNYDLMKQIIKEFPELFKKKK